jgi:hypothetical protein
MVREVFVVHADVEVHLLAYLASRMARTTITVMAKKHIFTLSNKLRLLDASRPEKN